MQLLTVPFPPFSCYLVPLGTNIFLSVKEQFHTHVKQQTKSVLHTEILSHAVARLVEAPRYKPEVAGSIPDGVNGIFH